MTFSRKSGVIYPLLLLLLLLSPVPWVQVAKGNEPPVITSVPPTEAWVNNSFQYDVVVTDIDSTTLSIKLDKAPNSMWVIPTTRSIYWVPNDDQVGPNEAIVNVSDGQTFTLQAFTVTVKKNHEPVIVSLPQEDATVGTEYLYNVEASDKEGDALDFTIEYGPPGMTMDPATGLLSWAPTEARLGDNFVKLVVTDWQLNTVQEFNITVARPFVNSAPVITSAPPSAELYVDKPFLFIVMATDTDVGDVLNYSLEEAPAGMAIYPVSGKVTWTPAKADVGSHNVSVKVSDGKGGVAFQNFTVRVVKMEIDPKQEGTDLTTPLLTVVIVLLVVAGCALILTRPSSKASEVKKEPGEKTKGGKGKNAHGGLGKARKG